MTSFAVNPGDGEVNHCLEPWFEFLDGIRAHLALDQLIHLPFCSSLHKMDEDKGDGQKCFGASWREGKPYGKSTYINLIRRLLSQETQYECECDVETCRHSANPTFFLSGT